MIETYLPKTIDSGWYEDMQQRNGDTGFGKNANSLI
jgi:hypothetical protein